MEVREGPPLEDPWSSGQHGKDHKDQGPLRGPKEVTCRQGEGRLHLRLPCRPQPNLPRQEAIPFSGNFQKALQGSLQPQREASAPRLETKTAAEDTAVRT